MVIFTTCSVNVKFFYYCFPEDLDDEPLQKKMRLKNNDKNRNDGNMLVELRLNSNGEINLTADETKIDSSLSDEEKHLITQLVEIGSDAIPLLEGVRILIFCFPVFQHFSILHMKL